MKPASQRRRPGENPREEGSISVEFALVAPLLVLLLLIVMDMGRFFFVQISLNSASHEAVRIASMREVSGSYMVSYANATAPGAAGMADGSDPAALVVKACVTSNGACVPAPVSLVNKYCNSTVGGDRVYVEVSTAFRWWTPVISTSTITITSKGVMLCAI